MSKTSAPQIDPEMSPEELEQLEPAQAVAYWRSRARWLEGHGKAVRATLRSAQPGPAHDGVAPRGVDDREPAAAPADQGTEDDGEQPAAHVLTQDPGDARELVGAWLGADLARAGLTVEADTLARHLDVSTFAGPDGRADREAVRELVAAVTEAARGGGR